MEILQQLMPSLRLDGYFILADLIGVPDLFRRIGPVLRSLIPGQPVDPRIGNLKRAARLTLTTWILIVLPLLLFELTLIVMNGPNMVRTAAQSLDDQVRVLIPDFAHGDIPSGAVGVISAVLLVMPIAGLTYILLTLGKKGIAPSSRPVAGVLSSACRTPRPSCWWPPGWLLTGGCCRSQVEPRGQRLPRERR